MFKNWTTKKTIWTLVIIVLLIAIYNWEKIAMQFGYDPNKRKFCGGGIPFVPLYETGGPITAACGTGDSNIYFGGQPELASTGIPIERVPVRR